MAFDAGLACSGKQCKEKYNFLLKEFRKNQIIAKQTSEGKIGWKHWNLMKENCIAGREIVPISASDTIINDSILDDDSFSNDKNDFNIAENKNNKNYKSKNEIFLKLAESIETKNAILSDLFQERKVESELTSKIKLLEADFIEIKDNLAKNNDN